jgi:predicted DNA-binding transcriptional regulator AlpA
MPTKTPAKQNSNAEAKAARREQLAQNARLAHAQRRDKMADIQAADVALVEQRRPDLSPDLDRLISRQELTDLLGVCYVTLWSWMQQGKFPRAIAIGAKSMWRASEVSAWLRSRPVARLKGDDDPKEHSRNRGVQS